MTDIPYLLDLVASQAEKIKELQVSKDILSKDHLFNSDAFTPSVALKKIKTRAESALQATKGDK